MYSNNKKLSELYGMMPTKRELEIFLSCCKIGTAATANQYRISISTVKTRITNIYDKLGVTRQGTAVMELFLRGYLYIDNSSIKMNYGFRKYNEALRAEVINSVINEYED